MNSIFSLVTHHLGYFEISPKPDPEYLKKYYNDRYYGNALIHNQYNYSYTPAELEHKLIDPNEALRYTSCSHGSLFEIGFGEGFFLSHFHELGWEIYGVDFTSHGLCQYHPHLQDMVLIGDVFDTLEQIVNQNQQYDLVVCNNVLEHVIDPISLLQQISKLLKSGGIARIVVPNDGSWLQQEIVDKGLSQPNYWVCPPDHLNYFTADSLVKLVEHCGLTTIDILATFPIDMFLLNSDTNYQKDSCLGRNCHFARVSFENALYRKSMDQLIAFRQGCAKAGIGRDLVLYCRTSRE